MGVDLQDSEGVKSESKDQKSSAKQSEMDFSNFYFSSAPNKPEESKDISSSSQAGSVISNLKASSAS